MAGDRHARLSGGRRGLDDGGPGSDFASDGGEDYVVAGSGDPGPEPGTPGLRSKRGTLAFENELG
jgi:hypothetical protein